jgi:hypothetical protein
MAVAGRCRVAGRRLETHCSMHEDSQEEVPMRKSTMVLVLSLVLAWGLVGEAAAVTYYVNSATGLDDPARGLTAALPFKTVQYAVAKTNATEIRIAAGTYTGPLSIPEFRKLTLRGAGLATTILSHDQSSPVVNVDGPAKVTLKGLTIQNGTHGIWSRMAYVVASNIRVRNNTSHAIYAKGGSYLSLSDSTVSTNGGHGVRIHSNSTGDFVGCTITSNVYSGMNVAYSSHAYIESCTISKNKKSGVEFFKDASGYFLNNAIFSNKFQGVNVTGSSSAGFGGGNKLYNNADDSGWRAGVGVGEGSNAGFGSELSNNPDEVYSNNGPGIFVYNGGGLLLNGARVHDNDEAGVSIGLGSSGQMEGAEIYENACEGVRVSGNSALFLKSGSVHNNGKDGVGLFNLSTGQFATGAQIDNNTHLGVNCGGGAGAGVAIGDAGSVAGNGSGQTNCAGWTP